MKIDLKRLNVAPELRDAAFDNGPLLIGHGQTISQPYIVALMTDLLQLEQAHIIILGLMSMMSWKFLNELKYKIAECLPV